MAADPLQEFLDDATRHAAYLTRYERGLLRRVLKLLAGLDAHVTEEIAARLAKLQAQDLLQVTTPNWTTQRLRELLVTIRTMSQHTREALNGQLRRELPALAEYELTWTATRLQAVAADGVTIDYAGITPEQAYAAVVAQPYLGVHMESDMTAMASIQQEAVKRAIRQGFLAAETIQQITRRILRDGVDRSKGDVTRIVRTAVNHTANVANEMLYARNTDIIKGVRWVSTLDGRTSAVCRARDGQVYEMGQGPRPPAHPNCRSRTVPILKSWAELGSIAPEDATEALVGERPAVRAKVPVSQIPKGERAGRITQVPGNVTYNEWLRTQPREFVNDVMGPTRARLYLDGKLTMDKFVDFSGHEYTLDQLRAKDPVAFERAGV